MGVSEDFKQAYEALLPQVPKQLVVLGGGKMSKALVQGFINGGCFKKDEVSVCTSSQASADKWRAEGYPNAYTKQVFYNVAKPEGIIMLGVKPQMLQTVLGEIRQVSWFSGDAYKRDNCRIFSILAGLELHALYAQFRTVDYTGAIVRLNPNIPAAVRAGVLLLCVPPAGKVGWEYDGSELAQILGETIGKCIAVPEKDFHAASALSGCGPGFVFTMIEALADGGVLAGLSRDLAAELAARAVLGASTMALESGGSPGKLKDDVCSAGGTTIAGIRELEKKGMRSAFIEAVFASTKRGEEMAKPK